MAPVHISYLAYHQSYRRWLGWLVIPLFLFVPFFWLDSFKFFSNSDALFYANILSIVTDHIKAGDVYPRWIADANSGFGSPVMMFYAPLAYIISALVNLPLTFLHPTIGTQLLISIYASQVFSGYTCYLWLRSRFSEIVAYSGSQLFVLLPFKLVYIFLNANMSQLWALAFLPLWVLAAQRMAEGKRGATGFYALMLALVYYTHPLTVIAFGAVPAAYVLWFGRQLFPRSYIKLAAAHIMGIGICLMQALPQAQYMNWISPSGFLSGIYVWKHNFLHIDVFLCAYYGIIAMLVGYGVSKIPALRKTLVSAECCFWILVIIGVGFMTERVSNFIWETITILQYLQFPAIRLHACALIAVTYLFCLWLTYYEPMQRFSKWAYRKETFALLIGVFGGWTYIHLLEIYAADASYDYHVSRETLLVIQPEYKTHWGCKDGFEVIDEYKKHITTPQTILESGKADITIEKWQPEDSIRLKVAVAKGGAAFAVRQCYIPKWQASDTHHPNLIIMPNKKGLMQLVLPEGNYDITFLQKPSALEIHSRYTSAGFALLCLLSFGGRKKTAKNFT